MTASANTSCVVTTRSHCQPVDALLAGCWPCCSEQRGRRKGAPRGHFGDALDGQRASFGRKSDASAGYVARQGASENSEIRPASAERQPELCAFPRHDFWRAEP